MTVLVFPSSIDASLAFVKSNKHQHKAVIGASSLVNDPFADHYDHWEYLPFIHEEGFSAALSSLIAKHGITSIFTPHAPSYLRLSELHQQLSNVQLIGAGPYASQMQRVMEAHKNAQQMLKAFEWLPNKPDTGLVAAILSQAAHLYGECAGEKIVALCAALACAPPGDVIEIGSFFGKSAYVLNRLAAHYKIGSTLAIDPWNEMHSCQHDSPATIQKLSSVWDWQLVFQGFLLNMQGCNGGNFNYLRLPSQRAWLHYQQVDHILTPEFGKTSLTGQIAVLHLDGNHDEKEVAADFESWSQRLLPGSWIIFDDYEWSQGDGPRVVANHVKQIWSERIAHFFVAGGAAFIQLKD